MKNVLSKSLLALLMGVMLHDVYAQEKYLSQNEIDVALMLSQADDYVWSKSYADALVLYQRVLQENPDDIETLVGMSNTLFYMGEYDNAVFYAQKSVDLWTESVLKDTEYSETIFTSYYRLAEIALRTDGDGDAFLSYLQAVLEYDENNPIYTDQWATQSMYNVLVSEGIGTLLQLFRFPLHYGIIAQREYALYQDSQENIDAIENMLYVFISVMSESIQYLTEYRPGFSYTDIRSVFLAAKEYSDLMEYFEEHRVYNLLYRIGRVLFEKGLSDEAQKIFFLLYDFSPQAQIKQYARNALDGRAEVLPYKPYFP